MPNAKRQIAACIGWMIDGKQQSHNSPFKRTLSCFESCTCLLCATRHAPIVAFLGLRIRRVPQASKGQKRPFFELLSDTIRLLCRCALSRRGPLWGALRRQAADTVPSRVPIEDESTRVVQASTDHRKQQLHGVLFVRSLISRGTQLLLGAALFTCFCLIVCLVIGGCL